MKWLTLSKIKQQLRLDPAYDLEDAELELYGESAEDTLLQMLDRSYEDVMEVYGRVPGPLVHASLLLVSQSYEHREAVTMQTLSLVPYGLDLLIKPYMRLTACCDATVKYERVPLGSDFKVAFTADLPDGLVLRDVDFDVAVVNFSAKDVAVEKHKSDCLPLTDDGSTYMLALNSEPLGVGLLRVNLTVWIPDEDFAGGRRKQIVHINPHIIIIG